jgi:hypothetical protein
MRSYQLTCDECGATGVVHPHARDAAAVLTPRHAMLSERGLGIGGTRYVAVRRRVCAGSERLPRAVLEVAGNE